MSWLSMLISSLVSLVQGSQSKLGNYDKQLVEQSVEQRILQGIDNGDQKEDKAFLIDVDVVRGSVFTKSKPRHGWSHAFYLGLLRAAFAPFYWDYWRGHTSLRWTFFIMFHFFLQFVQAICFLLVDPDTSNGSQDDVIIPCLLAICLGILHAHITPANGGRCGSVSTSDEGHARNVAYGDESVARTIAFSKNSSTQRIHVPSRRESLPHSLLSVDEVHSVRSHPDTFAELPVMLDASLRDSRPPPAAPQSQVSSVFPSSKCFPDPCNDHITDRFPVLDSSLVDKSKYTTHTGGTVHQQISARDRLPSTAEDTGAMDRFKRQMSCAAPIPEILPSYSSPPSSPSVSRAPVRHNDQFAAAFHRSHLKPQLGDEADIETSDSDDDNTRRTADRNDTSRFVSGRFKIPQRCIPVYTASDKQHLLDRKSLLPCSRHASACDLGKLVGHSNGPSNPPNEFLSTASSLAPQKIPMESATQASSPSSTTSSSFLSADETDLLPNLGDIVNTPARDLFNHKPHCSFNTFRHKSASLTSSYLGFGRRRSLSISVIENSGAHSVAGLTTYLPEVAPSVNILRLFQSTGNLSNFLMGPLISDCLHPVPVEHRLAFPTGLNYNPHTPVSSSKRSASTFSIDTRRDLRPDLPRLSDVTLSSDGSSSSPLMPSETSRIAHSRRLNMESIDEVGGGLYANPKCSTHFDPKLAASPSCEISTGLSGHCVRADEKTDVEKPLATVPLTTAVRSADAVPSNSHGYQSEVHTSASAFIPPVDHRLSDVQVGTEDDTITARCRQRTRFLRMFLHRACPLRPEDRSHSHFSREKSSNYHDLSTFSQSTSVLSPDAQTSVATPNSPRFHGSITGNKSHLAFRDPSNGRTKRNHIRIGHHINYSRRSTVHSSGVSSRFRSRSRWEGANQPQDSNRAQTASETEYDRLNSDVGSNVDSSSGPDEVVPPPSSITKQSTVDWNAGSTHHKTVSLDTGKPSRQRSTVEAPRVTRQFLRSSARSKRRRSVRSSKPILTGTSSYSAHCTSTHEPWVNLNGISGSDRSPGPLSQANASLSNAEANFTPTFLNESTTPQLEAPSEDHNTPRSACKVPSEQFLTNPPLPESFKKKWSSRSSTLTDTVRCYVWEGENVSKFDLTMLDIGCNVIRAVERQSISTDYILLACVVTVCLPMLSVAFHWNAFKSPLTVGNNSQLMNSAPTTPAFHIAWLSTDSSLGSFWPTVPILSDSLLGMQLRLVYRLMEKVSTVFRQPLRWLATLLSVDVTTTEHDAAWETFWLVITGRWFTNWLLAPDLRGRSVVILGIILRFNIYAVIFFLLCIAERTFQQRLLYAKYFFSLTSARRARKYRVPQFRLNKLRHIKCWLTLRSYLKKRGPQRSVETIIAAAFYIVFVFGLGLCSQLLSRKDDNVFSHLTNWDILGLVLAIMVFLHRFIILGTKITNKYRNFSVLITEQINLYLSVEKKPHKKDELMSTFQVLRLVESLLKEVDGPFRVCGWTVNPLVYNVFKLVLLSCFSSLLSETLGFKLKLYKLKLNAANW